MIKTKRISFSLVFTMAFKCLSNPLFFFSFWPYHLIKNKQTKKKKKNNLKNLRKKQNSETKTKGKNIPQRKDACYVHTVHPDPSEHVLPPKTWMT